jgi:adenylate cyclase
VGYGELQQLEQVEHFATAMSSASGPDLSGVEIAATAFANLLRGESIRELSLVHSLAIVFLAGFLSTVLCQRLGYRAALALTLVALVAYGGIAMLEFAGAALRLPIVLPMLVAAPTGMLASFTWQYWTARRQRERLRRAFAYFVPRDVVSRIEHNAEDIGRSAEALECACVATDAANYTPLAETMSPERLTEFLNQYYEALFGGVANGGGFVSDVVGDAMLAIWPGRAPDTRLRMLNALLEMRDAAERFNERLAGNRLVTRFGVDWGRVALTTVGAGTHYEYRAVGDAVNTAARIQELNKKLGTRVLISQPALGEATSDFLLRDLGRFWLRGKTNPVHVFELLGRRALATGEQLDLCTAFAAAMAALHDGQGARAQDRFLELQGFSKVR